MTLLRLECGARVLLWGTIERALVLNRRDPLAVVLNPPRCLGIVPLELSVVDLVLREES